MPYFFGLFADEACRGAGAREEKRVKQSEVEGESGAKELRESGPL